MLFFLFCAVMSLIALFVYAWDKRCAKRKCHRVSEATLLCLGMFGGSVGALLAMNLFHHKTKHWYFWVLNSIFLLLQAILFWWLKNNGNTAFG